MERTILHSDMNSCYASIELLHHPELRGKPLAVGGDPEARHGIVLAKDQLAKKAGVKTGMALWQARQACPDITFISPHMDMYLRFSRLAHEIYGEYTNLQEPFGIDESWLDVTQSCSLKGDGLTIAREISSRIKSELGITVSIGVSWNKIYAKLGSDYKKPDAITVFDRSNYRKLIWPLPAEDLLYVGRSTQKTLAKFGIYTIGELAGMNPEFLRCALGKMGLVLSMFANGFDQTPVNPEAAEAPIKSIGNSATTPRDLVCDEDVEILVYLLAESVAARLRENNFASTVVEISVRDNGLYSFTWQKKIEMPTDISGEIAKTAMQLFRTNYRWEKLIRSVGVRACGLVDALSPVQMNLFVDQEHWEKLRRMDGAVDDLRRRFGYQSIRRGLMYQDTKLSSINAKEDHTVHPHGYMEYGNRTGVESCFETV